MPTRFLRTLKLKQKTSRVSDFWRCKDHNIPKFPGVYLLIAKKCTFRYPTGRSPVYYIGKAKSLYKRILKDHYKWHSHVKGDRRKDNCFYEARHEYGGVFGGRYCYIQTWKRISPEKLEKIVIGAFVQSYHTIPVANRAGVGWIKKIKVKKSK
jgi:hypothetical protein